MTGGDGAFVRQFRTGRNMLGVAVQLCTLPWLGLVPDEVAAAPDAVVGRLSQRLGLTRGRRPGRGSGTLLSDRRCAELDLPLVPDAYLGRTPLAWTAEWYFRPETLEAANAAVLNAADSSAAIPPPADGKTAHTFGPISRSSRANDDWTGQRGVLTWH